MSTPTRGREPTDESLLYAPRWARLPAADGGSSSESERAMPAMIEDSPGVALDITQPTWVSPARLGLTPPTTLVP